MLKVYSIISKENKKKFITNGFNSGFRSNGCFVYEVQELDYSFNQLEKYKPDVIFTLKERSVNDEQILKYAKDNNKRIVFYDVDKINADFDEVVSVFTPDNLPLAANYKLYRIEDFQIAAYTISFAGNPLKENRLETLCSLIKVFKNKVAVFTKEKTFLKSIDRIINEKMLDDKDLEIYKKSYKGSIGNEKEMGLIYNSSKINLNITNHMNYKAFEIPAANGFMIISKFEGLSEYFDVSKDLETYKNIEDLIDKINFYLKNPEIADKIAINGYAKVIKKHNYIVRADMLLRAIGFKGQQ